MKTLLISYASGLASNPGIHVFLGSARCAFAPEVQILSPDDMPGVPTIPASVPRGDPILTRWHAFSDHLAKIAAITPDRLVLMADCRDIVFNSDPMPKAVQLLGTKGILFFSEHQLTREHSWCRNQAMLMHRHFRQRYQMDLPEINGGLILGKASALASLAKHLADIMPGLMKSRLSDQPLINRWARANPEACALAEDRALYCHGELVAKGRWKSGEPSECAIFHQYDRTPKYRAHYFEKFPIPREAFDREAVVSHYNEDAWIVRRWLPEIPIRVYTKGPAQTAPKDAVVLPNLGFEAQTWMHHFAANYESLPKITICLQADPRPHLRPEHHKLRLALLNLKADGFQFMAVAGSGHGCIQSRNGAPHHPGLGPQLEWFWQEAFGHPPPEQWWTFYGGQFAVHRDAVRRRPRAFYERMAALIKTKEQACAAERAWGALFSS